VTNSRQKKNLLGLIWTGI